MSDANEMKIAVAANDDCTIADSIENPPSLVVYEVKESDILSRTVRYFRKESVEVLEDCDTIIGRECGEIFKEKLSSKGLRPIFTKEDSADYAVGQLLNLKREDHNGPSEQTCRH